MSQYVSPWDYPVWASLMGQTVKRLSMMRETRVRSLGWEDPLEKEMASHSSTIAWKIPWKEKPGRLQSMRSQRVGHDWATSRSRSRSRYPVWDSLHFLDLGGSFPFLSTLQKFSTMISSNIFSSTFSSSQAPVIQMLVCLMLSQKPLRLSSLLFILFSFLCWASLIAQLVKNPPAMQETLVHSSVRKICWRRDRLPTAVFLGFPVAQLVKNPHAMQETWVLSPGEGKGYPLQYYGLENSMDCIVCGVTKSQTQLSNFHFSLFFTFYSVMWQRYPPFCLPGH